MANGVAVGPGVEVGVGAGARVDEAIFVGVTVDSASKSGPAGDDEGSVVPPAHWAKTNSDASNSKTVDARRARSGRDDEVCARAKYMVDKG